MQLGSVNKCGRIPVDQAIQETANREIKAPGGLHGPVLSQDTIALLNLGACISELWNITDDKKSSFDHPDLWRSEDLKNQTRYKEM